MLKPERIYDTGSSNFGLSRKSGISAFSKKTEICKNEICIFCVILTDLTKSYFEKEESL